MEEGRFRGSRHAVGTEDRHIVARAAAPVAVPVLAEPVFDAPAFGEPDFADPAFDESAFAEPDLPDIGPEAAGLLADLDEPHLVLSEGYVGVERRRQGLVARCMRATFGQRRSMLRLEVLVAAIVVILVVAALVLSRGGTVRNTTARATSTQSTSTRSSTTTRVTTPKAATPPPTAPATTSPPSTTVPVSAAAPAAAPAVAPTTTTTAPPAPAPSAAPTPSQLGAEALALVRYPWQSIPGYSIQFQPISDAPSPGFYGNTVFTWGQIGGTSTLYVFPGETVPQLAGIIAFEIAHEVDAAAVEPEGGETQIENILGIHPASWAPNCDCAEQDFLSGWYAATFSNYWSPGVGDWSQIAPEPTGAVLAAVEPWLNPTIP